MIVVASIMVFMVLLGAFTLMYQIFRLVVLDAESRGMKHPTFWGIFSLSGNNGGGGPVSYTHLDVYKRQSVYSSNKSIASIT